MAIKQKLREAAQRLFLRVLGPPPAKPTPTPALKFESEWRLYRLSQNPNYFPMIEGITQEGQKVRLMEVRFFWSSLSESVTFSVDGQPLNQPLPTTQERSLFKR